jgi:hypothetical protein
VQLQRGLEEAEYALAQLQSQTAVPAQEPPTP